MRQPSSMPYRGLTKKPWTQASGTPGTSWQSTILQASFTVHVLLTRLLTLWRTLPIRIKSHRCLNWLEDVIG